MIQVFYPGSDVARTVPDEYEPHERRLIAMFVRPRDRVLELGTAMGVVAMTAAKIVGAPNVLTIEANPEMLPIAQRNFQLNGMAAIKQKFGACQNRENYFPGELDFHIARNFLDSRLNNDGAGDIVRTVRVPVLCLEDEIAAHSANILICDIEGGETALLEQANLSRLRFLIIETHPGRGGSQDDINRMLSAVRAGGLRYVTNAAGTIVAFGRR